ncbi:MAG: AraC family transcriptional regulator [Oscillibacter sp.]|jgi:AraC-like DNA-binding protein|nr:AraC family transcriptional regulator [Oscillibacter sp.]
MWTSVEEYSFSVFPNENFLDLRLYQYGWEQCAPLHSFGPYVRNHYLFHYVVSGRGHLDATDASGMRRDYDLGPDQGFLICPGQISTYVADRDQPWKYVWLEFDGLRVSEFVESAGLDLSQPVYRPQNPAQGQRVRDIMLYMADHSDASPLHLTGLLFLFLDLLIQTSSTRRALHGVQLKDFYIQEAINYMERNYQRELSVEELADVCKLNRSYFSKLFKDSMGCPPQEFLIRLRLAHAADLMKGTRKSIGDIAARCGYPNQLHFSRAFKKRYGVSPREWRLENQIRQTKESRR